MNSFELNKILGAILATCLVVLTLNIAAGAIFAPGKLEKPGYAIAVPDQPAGGTETAKPEPAEPIAVRLASLRSASKGQAAAKQCAACHTFEKGGPNRVGPNLYGIVDRAKGARPGLQLLGRPEGERRRVDLRELDAFLASPKSYIPGTSMSYAGSRPRWAAGRPDQLSAYAVRQPGPAAEGGRGRAGRTGAGQELIWQKRVASDGRALPGRLRFEGAALPLSLRRLKAVNYRILSRRGWGCPQNCHR